MQLYVAAKALPEAAGKLREGAGSLSDVLSSQLEVFRGLGFVLSWQLKGSKASFKGI